MPLEPTRQPSEASSSKEHSFESQSLPTVPLWYACSKCYRSFKEIGLLRDHLRQKHGISEGDRTQHPGSNR